MSLAVDRRPVWIALLFSTLFHLSMVSIFSIVIWFPTTEGRYLTVSIARITPEQAKRPASTPQLQLPTPDALMDKQSGLAAEAANEYPANLPPIELPRLRAPELNLRQNEQERLKIRSLLSEAFEDDAKTQPDSWAIFTEQMREIGYTLTRWKRAPAEEATIRPARIALTSPVPGVSLHIEWVSKPRDRKVLFAPPIQTLWKADLAQLHDPIVLLFSVDAKGKTIEIQAASEDDAGVIAAAKEALANFKFEPIETDQARNQRGMLYIEARAPSP
jgi:hypothetical protein